MKQRLLTLVAFLFLAGNLFAQDQKRHCAAHEIHEKKLASDPAFAERYAKIEEHTKRFIQNYDGRTVSGGNIVIPCIVHVVYANAQENISDAQIQSQIDRLNKDYSATNADYNQVPSTFTSVRSGDTNIRFELIEVKRYSNSRSTWGTNDLVKQTYPPIEPARILNMWVADIGGGILGYAQFPGGSPSTDGVVMSPQYFGDASVAGGSNFYLSAPFNLGRTATHEVGHWLNLRHIWGDGGCSVDDFVTDTPVAGNPNYGCPAAGTNSCSGGLSDMFMNYMDYVDDACMFMFSAGQDARMQATFSSGGGRDGFLQAPNYNPGGGSGGGGGTTCNDTEVTLTLVTDNYGSETSWNLKNSSGSTIASGSGYGNNQTINQTFCLPNGTYTFTINDQYGDGICCSYGNGSYTIKQGSTTLASGGQFGSTESKNFTIGSTGGGGGGGGGSSAVLLDESFESGFGSWVDGGTDCLLYSGGTYAYDGNRAVDLQDNTSTSLVTSPVINASAYSSVEVKFYFYAVSMENGEDFWVQYTTNGSTYTTAASYARGTNFNNNTFYSATVNVPAASNLRIRFRCDASADNDDVYIDKVTVTGLSGARVAENTLTELKTLNTRALEEIGVEETSFALYPNPATYEANLKIALDSETMVSIQLYDMQGKLITVDKFEGQAGNHDKKLSLAGLRPGLYLVTMTTSDGFKKSTKLMVK